jgi:pimeloyl-ACP methyl ester carboxylesterase
VIKFWAIGIGGVVLLYMGAIVAVSLNQRRMIFFPSHDAPDGPLQPWIVGGRTLGYCQRVERPRTVWLMAHGNAGQASGRAYVLPRMAPGDALFVVEYPGYGQRPGSPTMSAMNAAVAEAYEALRNEYPDTPVCALGESLGSGPVSMLATRRRPPDKIILAVPFDTLARVAAGHFRWLPVSFILQDRWDNIAALKGYTGPIDIFCAAEDRIIPSTHARTLADALPQARFVSFHGAHNEWANPTTLRIER